MSAGYGDSRKRVLIANSDGLLADDEVVRCLLRISAVADGDTGMQTGFQSMGHTIGFEVFDTVDVEQLARDAARQAITKLDARPAPSGSMPVVIQQGTGGVLFHEACGHGLEADLVGKGASVYKGKTGQLVASPLVTVVDDGTMAGEWGTLSIDDEGHRTQRNVLIEDGVLTDYMWDFLRSRKEGRAPSGNGRRQSYMHLPMVRMTNTFVTDGDSDPADIISTTEQGVYVAKLGGGQVNTASGDFVFGMTEAYLIENGEITAPLREANLIGNGPAGAARHRPGRQRLRHGRPRHVRQGRPGRAGRHRPADAARRRAHRRRDGGMSAELQVLADKVVAQAQAGEQIEAYVSRGGETEVRVYDGEVEHFVSAQSEGIGVRVIRDGRTGFAYAGTLDPGAVDEVLAEARDNVAFGTVDEWAGLAEPDGVPRTEQPLWNDELAAFPTERKIELAKELERLTLAADRRVRVDDANYADAWGEVAVATTTGIRESGRENGCYVSVSSLADDGDETQTGFGFSVARQPGGFDLDKAANDAADRATRLLGATKPASKRLTVVLDPFVTAQFLGVISSTLNGESVVKGRSLFRDRLGEQVAADIVTLVDDPTNPEAYTATDVDGEGLAARRNVLIDRRRVAAVRARHYSARRAGTVSTGNATRAGFAGTPGVGCLALQLQPGTRSQVELIADVDDGLLVQSVAGLHSGVNPVSGDFSTGASGMLITNGTVGAPVRELTIASTLQRMLLDIVEIGGDVDWLPMRAAGVSLVIRDVTMSGA